MTSRWTREHVALLDGAPVDRLPPVTIDQVIAVADGIDIWDSWPIRTPGGAVADVCGHEVWIALAAPAVDDPALRHDVAHHRAVIVHSDGSYTDLGELFPSSDALGTRQWAGATALDGDRVTAYYTAAGVVGADPPGFRQRPAAVTGRVRCVGGVPTFTDWSEHREILEPDPDRYDTADDPDGEPGFIKAFRDPFPFVDPATGEEYLVVTGSLPPDRSTTDFNGAVGIARRSGPGVDDWVLLDPVLTADSVNNELERAHLVMHAGRYHLFFSTQARTFHPDLTAPTGLYGFVADDILGPYEPLNGHGLVVANPPDRPIGVYSWLVLDDFSIVAFVDSFGVDAEGLNEFTTPTERRLGEFGGTFAPTVHITVDGATARLVPS